jgi:hypothetical protein
MEVPQEMVFSMRSAQIVMACNNRGTVESDVLCGSMQRLYLENRNTAESVKSGAELELGGHHKPAAPLAEA